MGAQGMPSIRKQSMETDEYQPVEDVEAQSLRRGAQQDNNLLTQGQVLGFKARS